MASKSLGRFGKVAALLCALTVVFGLTWPLFDIYPNWVATTVTAALSYLLGWLLGGD